MGNARHGFYDLVVSLLLLPTRIDIESLVVLYDKGTLLTYPAYITHYQHFDLPYSSTKIGNVRDGERNTFNIRAYEIEVSRERH